jgi:hypothetical protein
MLIWAAGDSRRISYHGAKRGGVSVLLHDLPPCPANTTDFAANCSMFPAGAAAAEMPRSPGAKTMDITFTKQQVRGQGTFKKRENEDRQLLRRLLHA